MCFMQSLKTDTPVVMLKSYKSHSTTEEIYGDKLYWAESWSRACCSKTRMETTSSLRVCVLLNEWMFALLLFSELLSWEGKRSLQGCCFSLRRRCSGFGWERCGIELLVGSCLSVVCILSVDLLPTSLIPDERIILVAKTSDSNTFSLFKDRYLYMKDISVSKRIKYGNDLCAIIVPAQLHMLCFDSSAHTACLNNSGQWNKWVAGSGQWFKEAVEGWWQWLQ